MGRYRSVLNRKISEEKKEEAIQKELRMENGIGTDKYKLKERGFKSYAAQLARDLAYLIQVVLAFIGMLMMLYQPSRDVILQILRLG